MTTQFNTLDQAIENVTNLNCFSPELFEIANKVDDKFATAPEAEFISTGGRFYDKKVTFNYNGDSYVAEVIVLITSETANVRNTYTQGYNIYKLA